MNQSLADILDFMPERTANSEPSHGLGNGFHKQYMLSPGGGFLPV